MSVIGVCEGEIWYVGSSETNKWKLNGAVGVNQAMHHLCKIVLSENNIISNIQLIMIHDKTLSK